MVSMLVCVVVQNVSTRVNLDHVLKLGVDDKVDCIGEWLSKMKFYSQISLLYKLKMVTRAVSGDKSKQNAVYPEP